MEKFYAFCQNKKIEIFTSLIFILASITFRSFVVILISLVTQSFSSVLKYLPALITYLMPIVFFILFIKHFYYKKVSKPGLIVFFALTTASLILALVLFSLNFETYINSFTYHSINIIFPFDVLAIILAGLSVNIMIMLKTFFKEDNVNGVKDQEEQLILLAQSSGKFAFKTYQFILFIIYVLLVLFFTMNFFYGFSAITNITLDPVGFIILLLLNILPLFNLISFITIGNKNPIKRSTIVSLINLAILLAFVIYQLIFPDFVVRIGKVFFPVDFAISFSVGPILLGISAILPSVYFFIAVYKAKHNNNAFLKEEQNNKQE